MSRMPRVIRLLAVADARDPVSAEQISVSVRLTAVLDDGRTVTLLEGRGWTAELRGPGAAGVADIWETTTAREIEQTARVVVGPDEPFGDRTQADMERDHWEALAGCLRENGVDSHGAELSRLAVEVVTTERLRSLIGGRT
jgi:hypothetical protein